jgi:hypothetical protein
MVREGIDTQWPCKIALQPLDCPRYLLALTPGRSYLAEARALIAYK